MPVTRSPIGILLLSALSVLTGSSCAADYDVVLRGGTIYDGSGGEPVVGDVAIKGDSIVLVGVEVAGRGRVEHDVSGLAVAPGFINMLSWATESLIEDRKSVV